MIAWLMKALGTNLLYNEFGSIQTVGSIALYVVRHDKYYKPSLLLSKDKIANPKLQAL